MFADKTHFSDEPSMPTRGGLWLTIAAGFFLTAAQGAAATDSPQGTAPVRIARFQGDRQGAISLTFDDGLRDQYDLAVPILNRLDFKATFFIIAGRTPETDEEAQAKRPGDWGGISWPQIKTLAAQGHEIGNHSWTHAPLTKIDDAAARRRSRQVVRRDRRSRGQTAADFLLSGQWIRRPGEGGRACGDI